jgi:hypothetical protein
MRVQSLDRPGELPGAGDDFSLFAVGFDISQDDAFSPMATSGDTTSLPPDIHGDADISVFHDVWALDEEIVSESVVPKQEASPRVFATSAAPLPAAPPAAPAVSRSATTLPAAVNHIHKSSSATEVGTETEEEKRLRKYAAFCGWVFFS